MQRIRWLGRRIWQLLGDLSTLEWVIAVAVGAGTSGVGVTLGLEHLLAGASWWTRLAFSLSVGLFVFGVALRVFVHPRSARLAKRFYEDADWFTRYRYLWWQSEGFDFDTHKFDQKCLIRVGIENTGGEVAEDIRFQVLAVGATREPAFSGPLGDKEGMHIPESPSQVIEPENPDFRDLRPSDEALFHLATVEATSFEGGNGDENREDPEWRIFPNWQPVQKRGRPLLDHQQLRTVFVMRCKVTSRSASSIEVLLRVWRTGDAIEAKVDATRYGFSL